MKLFEYQAKKLFGEYKIPTERFFLCKSPQEVKDTFTKKGFTKAVLKSQVLTGGRGKAGGIKFVKNMDEVTAAAEMLFSLNIKGYPVEKVLVSDAVAISKEFYIGFAVDRNTKSVVFISSEAGGVDIEEVAATMPERINTHRIDALLGVPGFLSRYLAYQLVDTPEVAEQISTIVRQMYTLMIEKDASLVEINPMVVTLEGGVLAIDAKITIDDNARYRQPELFGEYQHTDAELIEESAREKGFSYVQLDGDIGCMVNGAGLAMATMDLITHYGGKPANFLDIGGSSNPKKVAEAMKILLNDPKVKVVLINIFGGITRCDDVAIGLIEALNFIETDVPLIVRLTGTNEKEGIDLLKGSPYVVVDSMAGATQMAIKLLKE